MTEEQRNREVVHVSGVMMSRGHKMDSENAISLLREAWVARQEYLRVGDGSLFDKQARETWNKICDVLAYADRFKL